MSVKTAFFASALWTASALVAPIALAQSQDQKSTDAQHSAQQAKTSAEEAAAKARAAERKAKVAEQDAQRGKRSGAAEEEEEDKHGDATR